MARRYLSLQAASIAGLSPALARLRDELEVPGEFAAAAREEAEAAAASVRLPERDATDIEFVTIDPPDALDLDQALHLSRDGDGYLISYAIADPAAFISPGGPLDQAVHERGVTYYGPDGRISLHPPVLSEGAASLLPEQVRPACLWQITLDGAGEITAAHVERAQVRSRAKLSYREVQAGIDDGSAGPMLDLLGVVGELRRQRELDRGGVSLAIPEQEVATDGDRYTLEYRATLDVEDWNAQISLTTGIAAAAMMRTARIGVLRTLPQADPRDVERLRRAAHGLGIAWSAQEHYGAVLRRLDASVPAHAAFLDEATSLFRGADYLPFDGDLPPASPHGAIGAEYAHVTAPLRRLVDRYGLEICLAHSSGDEVPTWVREGLAALPDTMAATTRAANAYERECVNLIEAAILAPRVGETFDGVVVDVQRPQESAQRPQESAQRPQESAQRAQESAERGTVVIADPAVRAKVTGTGLPLGESSRVRLAQADLGTRAVAFTYDPDPAASGPEPVHEPAAVPTRPHR